MNKELITRATKAVDHANTLIEKESRSYDHDHFICANVKQQSNSANLEKVLSSYQYRTMQRSKKFKKLTEKEKALLREHFTEEELQHCWDNWIESESSYWLNDFIGERCTLDSPEFLQKEVLKKVFDGKPTPYPTINELPTRAEKIAEAEKWIKDSAFQNLMLDQLDTDEMSFYGRSGGWMSICKTTTYDRFIQEVNEAKENYEENPNEEGMESELQLAVNALELKTQAIEWLLNLTEDTNRKMKFEDEVHYRIGEQLEEIQNEIKRDTEIATAKKLAKKHGLVLAKEIK